MSFNIFGIPIGPQGSTPPPPPPPKPADAIGRQLGLEQQPGQYQAYYNANPGAGFTDSTAYGSATSGTTIDNGYSGAASSPYSGVTDPTASTQAPAAAAPFTALPTSTQTQTPAAQTSAASTYPAMPNSAGLGTTPVAATAAAPAAGGATALPSVQDTSSYATTPSTANTQIADSSRGFNPWSLVGEANSRTDGPATPPAAPAN